VEQLSVAVFATDPIDRSGVVSLLGGRRELRVLPEWDGSLVDVLVLAVHEITATTIATLRRAGGEGADWPSRPRFIVITDHFHEPDLLAAVDSGVVAVLRRRDVTTERLLATVMAITRGSADLPPALQGLLLTRLRHLRREVLDPNGLTLSGLTSRECDVLRLLANGLGTADIATELRYSERTVKNVLYRLMNRLRLNNRAHAVAYAMRVGAI
jgi:DNA-binding NarL/FixJ family response regulator